MKALLDNFTPDQQLQLLITQNNDGNTALHFAAQEGHTETMKTLLDNLAPDQQLKLLSVQNIKSKTAQQRGTSDAVTILEKYQVEADYRVNYRKFPSLINNFKLCITPINVNFLDDF